MGLTHSIVYLYVYWKNYKFFLKKTETPNVRKRTLNISMEVWNKLDIHYRKYPIDLT
jgi:hypothetical protein